MSFQFPIESSLFQALNWQKKQVNRQESKSEVGLTEGLGPPSFFSSLARRSSYGPPTEGLEQANFNPVSRGALFEEKLHKRAMGHKKGFYLTYI